MWPSIGMMTLARK